MTRRVFFVLGMGLALPAAAQMASIEAFPVDHKEPITIRVLNGKSGQPMPNVRLVLLAGYQESDIRDEIWSGEVMTNEDGQVLLPRPLMNLAFLEASLVRVKLCQHSAHGELYAIERIRRDGWNAPNRCGVVSIANAPGVLTLFARPHGPSKKNAALLAKTAPERLDFPLAAQTEASHTNEIQTLLELEP